MADRDGETDARADRDQSFAALMRKAQDGDEGAYLRLLTELAPLLRQAVRRRRGFLQASDVEDLVQDILLSVHAARATYDPERPFWPWLTAILRNRMADGARRHARQAAKAAAFERESVTFGDKESNGYIESYGDPEALRREIGRLPDGQRRAIEMVKLRELSLKEASAASGMSVGALKVAVWRAVRTLRNALAKEKSDREDR